MKIEQVLITIKTSFKSSNQLSWFPFWKRPHFLGNVPYMWLQQKQPCPCESILPYDKWYTQSGSNIQTRTILSSSIWTNWLFWAGFVCHLSLSGWADWEPENSQAIVSYIFHSVHSETKKTERIMKWMQIIKEKMKDRKKNWELSNPWVHFFFLLIIGYFPNCVKYSCRLLIHCPCLTEFLNLQTKQSWLMREQRWTEYLVPGTGGLNRKRILIAMFIEDLLYAACYFI